MQPETRPPVIRIAAKEMTLFFTTPVAYLFLAAFAAVSLFAVFWGEAFFARNLADLKPLFAWMPLLLLFLASAVTMRLWSEERRQGTLEHVLTSPVPTWHFVLGKYLACLGLLAVALFLTTPLPITVSFMGDLDWGPVLAGYLATFLLGGAYLAVGLLVSSRTANQIVSLLGSVGLCGLLYLVGSPGFTQLFDARTADWMRLLGTGSRFESIVRGVLDMGDLAYYLGMILTCLALNAFLLESERWSSKTSKSQTDWRVVTGLVVANAIGLNLWLGQLHWRVDMTEGDQYSLSQATRTQLDGLTEPLQIKAYFSQKTHPLLAPLVPQLKDLLKEYAAVSDGKVRVEFIDPRQSPELEEQAKEEFGVEPVPFQVADRYEAAIVNSYFNIVVKYGDAYQVLGFSDLIEVKAHAMENVDVQLKNPEYDITRAIKKAVDEYQKQGRIYDSLSQPVTLKLFLSEPDNLPKKLVEFRKVVEESAEDMKSKSDGKLNVEVVNPDVDKQVQATLEKLDLKPMASGLFDTKRFYFYMALQQGDRMLRIPLGDLSKADFERNMQSGLKHFGSGYSKTVAMAAPDAQKYSQLKEYLSDGLNVASEDLKDGSVAGNADILLLLGPEKLEPEEVYAVDQFLMRGGTVVAAVSPYKAEVSAQGLSMNEHESGLEEWLKHLGVSIEKTLVLDEQCASIPIPVTRYLGGRPVQAVSLLDYPYFVDVRKDGFAEDHPIFSGLGQVVASWASPIHMEGEGKSTTLLSSTKNSWTSASPNVAPELDQYGNPMIPRGIPQGKQALATLVSGPFDSYYKPDQKKEILDKIAEVARATIETSPDSARLVLFSSDSMFSDQFVRMMGGLGAGDPTANLGLMANVIDWATQDESLLSIRSRSHFSRTLYPMDRQKQMVWEWLNYILAFLLLVLVGVVSHLRIRRRASEYERLLHS